MTLTELITVLSSLQSGLTELYCHPGYEDDDFYRIYRNRFHGEKELNALLSPEVRQCAEQHHVRLTNYRQMAELNKAFSA
jgi:chitin disaccharide deacetylase